MKTKAIHKLFAILTALALCVGLLPMTAFAAGSFMRKVVYADSAMKNFAFEASGDITIPVAVFVYGTGENVSYEITAEDASGKLSLAGVDASFGEGAYPGEHFMVDLFAGATLTMGVLKALAIPNPELHDDENYSDATAEEIALAFLSSRIDVFSVSMTSESCEMDGYFWSVVIENGQEWTVPSETGLTVANFLEINGELRGTDETSYLYLLNLEDGFTELLGDGLNLYADIGEPELLEITPENWGEIVVAAGEVYEFAFNWLDGKWIYFAENNEPPAPSENQFRIFWDDYFPMGGNASVVSYKIGDGNVQSAEMGALTDIALGASLTFIYTPAIDGEGNPDNFWGIEVCFEGEAPYYIDKENMTENNGTYSYTIDRSENSAGLNVGAWRNNPQGPSSFGDRELFDDFFGGGEYDNIITNGFTWTVPAGGDQSKLIVRDNLEVSQGGSLVGEDDSSVLEVQTITNVKGIQLYTENGVDLMNDAATGELLGVENFGQWVAFQWRSDRWVLRVGGEPQPPEEYDLTNGQFRLLRDNYIPQNGTPASLTYQQLDGAGVAIDETPVASDVDGVYSFSENAASIKLVYTPHIENGVVDHFGGFRVTTYGESRTVENISKYDGRVTYNDEDESYTVEIDRPLDDSAIFIEAVRNFSEVYGTVESYGSNTDDVVIELIPDGSVEVRYCVRITGTFFDYFIPDVEQGRYTLKISKANHRPREYSIDIGGGDCKMNLVIFPEGDCNLDGKVDADDFSRVVNVALSGGSLATVDREDYEASAFDLNGDGVVDALDCAIVERRMNGH